MIAVMNGIFSVVDGGELLRRSSGSSRRRRSRSRACRAGRRPRRAPPAPRSPSCRGRPELIHVRGFSNGQNCDAHIWCWPTPATTIVSPSLRRREPLDRELRLQRAVGLLVVAERVLRLPLRELRRATALRSGMPASSWRRVSSARASPITSLQSPTIGTSADAVLADLGRVDVDVDDLGVRRERGELAGDAVVEPRAERDQQVGLLHRRHGRVVAVHAGHAEAELVRVGERAARHQRRDDGEVPDRRELEELLRGARP